MERTGERVFAKLGKDLVGKRGAPLGLILPELVGEADNRGCLFRWGR